MSTATCLGGSTPSPSATSSWRASPISDGSWLLTSHPGHPGVCRCESCALRHSCTVRPATVFASSRPRDPRRARTPRGLWPERVVFAADRGSTGKAPDSKSGSCRFDSCRPRSSLRGPMAMTPPCHGGDAGSIPAAGSISGSSSGRTPGYEPGGRRFESCPRGHCSLSW